MAFKLVSASDFIPRFFEVLVAVFRGKGESKYNATAFGKDCLAGVTVGIVALPLAMAFSIAAGGTPAQGLYTAVFAGFCVSLLGGSKFQIAGPTGAFVVVIFGVISHHGMSGLIVASLLTGIILMVMGFSGVGRFIKFIPYPVTTGFTTGIGLLIFSQQVKDFFGLSLAHSSPEFFASWKEYALSFHTLDPTTLAVGLGTMALIILLRKLSRRIPGSVAAVVAATVVCALCNLPIETIGSRFGGIPSTLPMPAMPAVSWSLIRDVFPDAFTMALLAGIESLLSAIVADGMSGDRHNANMELVAQGVANSVCALFGGIPATGAIARTATNIKSGAVSPVSGIIHSITLVLFILFLAPAAKAVPLASLSAVLMVVAWDMSDLSRFVRIIRRAPKSDATVLITTFALTVAVNLTVAVEVGVVLAVFLFMRRMVEVGGISAGDDSISAQLLPGRKQADSSAYQRRKGIEVYTITGPFFFGVADRLQRTLEQLGKPPEVFILRMKDVPAIDSTGITALEAFFARCKHGKTELFLSEMQAQPYKALKKAGFIDLVGEKNIFDTVDAAITSAEEMRG